MVQWKKEENKIDKINFNLKLDFYLAMSKNVSRWHIITCTFPVTVRDSPSILLEVMEE